MKDVLIIIPTYNEIENIENIIISTINLYPTINILIVDDNSPDLTFKKVEDLMLKFKDQLFLLKRLKKEGLGTAYVAGFKWALKNKFNYVFEMDADLSHNPQDIKRILEPMLENNYDISIGSRYIKGINVVNWPLSRIILSYTASLYVRFITRMKIKDSTSGYICYKKSVLESIDLDNIKFTGYAFQIEMKYKSYLKNFKIIEVPIIFSDRKFGISKLNGSIISEAIFGVIAMRIKKIFNIEPSDQRAVRLRNRATEANSINQFNSVLAILVLIIGLGTLIAGIVGISNIMIFIVKERTKEIGIRKALGARPSSIQSIILIESVLITSISGYVGLLLGIGILEAYGPSLDKYFITDPSVSTNLVAMATLALIISGFIAAYVPAKRASQIKPIIALRDE